MMKSSKPFEEEDNKNEFMAKYKPNKSQELDFTENKEAEIVKENDPLKKLNADAVNEILELDSCATLPDVSGEYKKNFHLATTIEID